ncbi:geranylgeranyl reductase family protein [Halohasta litchfieldiae]|jgi:electron-transferring-flavoprotein dehydrogenase|uniref:Geranylgeranyl reductase family n=1 Tax=Halohasta litchfieldiae TaxID=1073996 RepID=A0A1H6UJ49_9EURY|nr:geranylgeranyl reductase family protein [Halohasta litchfieldiae]ATW89053.1 geranylgeranyl reductase family protein [Halohasta litchfieldiae]SEI88195.1 geranylgeranyl reductase family [Halohasta litchfieldiae]
MYDFVVVGVGPAGGRFARRAAESGFDVLALEKGTVGTPLACSGHVSTDIWNYVPDSAREDLFQNRIYGANFYTGGPDTASHRFYKTEEVSNVVDRVALDRTLADCARRAGADVREGHTVTGIEEHPDRVTVTASVAGEKGTQTFEARMVAGCDGPVSRVRQAVDLPEPGEKIHGVLAFTDEVDHSDHVDVHLTVPRFFAWRIPRGEAGVEYGLAAPPGGDVNDRFQLLTDAYGVETDRFCSGAIPIGPPDSVTTDRVFLIGDAAGQTKPFTGGGILYGMTAADCAARHIRPDRPESLGIYESAWRETLSTEIQMGHLIRRAYSLPKPVQRVGLGALAGEIGVHMDKPSSFFSKSHLKRLFS